MWLSFSRWRMNVQIKDTPRNISKFLKSLNLKIECPLVLDFNYSVGVISKNEKLKTNVGFLYHVVFSNYFCLHVGEVTSKLKTHLESNS